MNIKVTTNISLFIYLKFSAMCTRL